ncbi:unnamed protein product [Lepeophtheirus salmonis]|uniref:(salmon louse) hypothetical protein n=1 Tax=Lepeophtheirus salmonis TaxID=72036 RepID=A0A7R8HA60_LEPSM|nr:unnamed protein product [Lepeophtheirus salmonis]CAF2967369.1 unnamed protein product [Lepeophtheirus salmonis]
MAETEPKSTLAVTCMVVDSEQFEPCLFIKRKMLYRSKVSERMNRSSDKSRIIFLFLLCLRLRVRFSVTIRLIDSPSSTYVQTSISIKSRTVVHFIVLMIYAYVAMTHFKAEGSNSTSS